MFFSHTGATEMMCFSHRRHVGVPCPARRTSIARDCQIDSEVYTTVLLGLVDKATNGPSEGQAQASDERFLRSRMNCCSLQAKHRPHYYFPGATFY